MSKLVTLLPESGKPDLRDPCDLCDAITLAMYFDHALDLTLCRGHVEDPVTVPASRAAPVTSGVE